MKKRQLRAYIIYNERYGASEGSFLVFHFTGKEAKALFWPRCPFDFVEYIDISWRWRRDWENLVLLGDPEKIAANEPHIVDAPEYCMSCDIWGAGVNQDGTCKWCGEEVGEGLRKLYGLNPQGVESMP